jgi:hypothetical protein
MHSIHTPPSKKHVITCQSWRPLRKNSLLGFATVRIDGVRLTIKDIAIHEKNGRRWAALPARPQLADGKVVMENGKPQYFSLMTFDDRTTADAFSDAVIAAVLAHEPRAFADGAERPQSPQRGDIPF